MSFCDYCCLCQNLHPMWKLHILKRALKSAFRVPSSKRIVMWFLEKTLHIWRTCNMFFFKKAYLFGQFRSIGLQQYLSTSVHSTWDDVQKSQRTSNWSVNGCVCYITLCKSWKENESSNIPPLQLGTDVALRLQWCPFQHTHMFDPTILVPEKRRGTLLQCLGYCLAKRLLQFKNTSGIQTSLRPPKTAC